MAVAGGVMEFEIGSDAESRIVTCTASGELDLGEGARMAREARKRSHELGYGLLYDVRAVSVKASLVDAYDFPRRIDELYEKPEHRSARAAILFEKDDAFWRFFETVVRNLRLMVRIFQDQQEALRWLRDPERR